MTLHNAKGLEFKAVYLIGLEEGIFPHSRSIEEHGVEEERRLMYVGMTRAKERLTLLHASSRMLYGGRSYNMASRFLDELPEQHVERDRLAPCIVVRLRRSEAELREDPRERPASPPATRCGTAPSARASFCAWSRAGWPSSASPGTAPSGA